LKTADEGYLTRRLHDVSQDVIVNLDDCGTLRGVEVSALKKNEEIVETLGERILGRVALQDVINPLTSEILVNAGEQIVESIVKAIEDEKPEEIEFVEPPALDTSFRYKSTDVKFPIAYAKATHFELKEVNWRKLSYTYLNPEHPIVPKLSSGIGQDAYGDFIFKKLKKGAFTGNLLHSIFENIAFNDPYHWDKVVKRSLKRLALVNQDLYNEKLLDLLKHVTETDLNDGQRTFKLSEVSNAVRLNEFEFDFSVKPFQTQAIKQLSKPAVPFHLRNADHLEGMMNGKIDLFFEHAGKYYILDWKSNFLGDRVEDYSQEKVWAAMDENNYHLQYHIYTSAVCKYLKMRKPDFNYKTEFGGVFYLFLRGVRNDGNYGLFFHKPELVIIDQLSNILT
jgi:exodeoxyribonuclease V beta subunit